MDFSFDAKAYCSECKKNGDCEKREQPKAILCLIERSVYSISLGNNITVKISEENEPTLDSIELDRWIVVKP